MDEFMDDENYDINSISEPLEFAMGGSVESMHLSPYTPTNQESGDMQDSHSMPMTYAHGGAVHKPRRARAMLQKFADGGLVQSGLGTPFDLTPFGGTPAAGAANTPEALFRASSPYSQKQIFVPGAMDNVQQQTDDMLRQKLQMEPTARQSSYWGGIFNQDKQITPNEVEQLDQAIKNAGNTPGAFTPTVPGNIQMQDVFGPMSMMTGGADKKGQWTAPVVTTRPAELQTYQPGLSASQQLARDLSAQDKVTGEIQNQLSGLYASELNRSPDRAGMDYWTKKFSADGKLTDAEIAEWKKATQDEKLNPPPGMKDAYSGDVAGATEYLKNLYLKELNREADTKGLDFWVKRIGADGIISAAELAEWRRAASRETPTTPTPPGTDTGGTGGGTTGGGTTGGGTTGGGTTGGGTATNPFQGDAAGAKAYLQQLYLNELKRPADTAGLDYWMKEIGADGIITAEELARWRARAQQESTGGGTTTNTGGGTTTNTGGGTTNTGGTTTVTNPFQGDAAGAKAYLEQLYLNELKRPADAKGLDYWMKQIGSDGVITAEELASWRARAQDELNNPTNTGGTTTNTGGTTTNTGGTTTNNPFQGDAAGTKAYLQQLYLNELKRPADSKGLKYWMKQIGSDGVITAEELASWRAAAQDELNKPKTTGSTTTTTGGTTTNTGGTATGNQTDNAYSGTSRGVNSFLQDLYQSELGRAADTEGLNYWMKEIGSDGVITQDELKKWQAGAAKEKSARSQLNALYESVLGRTADTAGMEYWLKQAGADGVIDKDEEAAFRAAAQGELSAVKKAKGGLIKKDDGGEGLAPVKRADGSPEYGEIAIGGGVTPDTKKALSTNQSLNSTEALKLLRRVYGEGASNLESTLRGSVAAIPGAVGDIESLFRESDKTRRFATTEEVLRDYMPKRLTTPTKEGKGFEEVGSYLPLPIPAGTVSKGVQTVGRAGERLAERNVPRIMERGGKGAKMLEAFAQNTASNVVKPKGGTFYPPEMGSNLNTYLDRLVKGLSQSETLGGRDAKAVADFIQTKGRKYFTSTYGTADDPLRLAVSEGRMPLYGSDDERFRDYLLDAARAGNPKAVKDLERIYDESTNLGTQFYSPAGSTEPTYALANRMQAAQREKLLAEGVPEDLINPNYPAVNTAQQMSQTPYAEAKRNLGQLLQGMEELPPEAREAYMRGTDKDFQSLLYAATKEQPIYDLGGNPSMDFLNVRNLPEAIASIPVSDLERMTFPEAVIKGSQNMRIKRDRGLVLEKARDGKPIPKEIYLEGTETVSGTGIPLRVGENLQWVRIMTPDAVELEGAAMRHSVGDYKHKDVYLGGKEGFKSGRARVYSLRNDKGVPQITVEMEALPDEGGLRVTRQVQGKFNSEPNEEQKRAIFQLFDELNPQSIASTTYSATRTGDRLKDEANVNWGDLYNQYKNYKEGTQGFSKGGIVKKAAAMLKDLGVKEEKIASKELTTLQDTHTSLNDSVRARAAKMQQQMDAMGFKYEPGQRVFTEDSAKKNKPPYTIKSKQLYGNIPMREPHPVNPLMGKVIKDPKTGKTQRTPYEPGYLVRYEDGDKWSEFVLPESAIKGSVDEFAKGGAVKKSATLDFIKKANARL